MTEQIEALARRWRQALADGLIVRREDSLVLYTIVDRQAEDLTGDLVAAGRHARRDPETLNVNIFFASLVPHEPGASHA